MGDITFHVPFGHVAPACELSVCTSAFCSLLQVPHGAHLVVLGGKEAAGNLIISAISLLLEKN